MRLRSIAIEFLAVLSSQFDFGVCINPARERPDFFQGRLLGALIPFAILYVYGLSCLLRHKSSLVPGRVGVIPIVTKILDLLANCVAFTSAYNWFHM